MRKATAIYHAPDGDADSCQMGDVTFKDGESVELNTNDNEHLINKLQNNKHFELEIGEDNGDKPRRGRPPGKRDFKAGIEEANDHDFEKDRRDNMKGTVKTDEPVVIKPVAEPAE